MDASNDLFSAVRARAAEPSTRRAGGAASQSVPFPCASPAQLEEAERQLGFSLHPLHRRLLLEVGNGGFGPGCGILGIAGGQLDDGRSLVEMKREWAPCFPARIMPLCDWGCTIWSCIDSSSRDGVMLTLNNGELTVTSYTLQTWLEDWVAGTDIFENLFEFMEATGVNPFTREPMIFSAPSRAKGTPYRLLS